MIFVSALASQGGNITVMDATIDDSQYYMASTMKKMISAEYTGEIRYDGYNHRLVFIDVKADITTLNYLLNVSEQYVGGFTISFYGKNEFTSYNRNRCQFVC